MNFYLEERKKGEVRVVGSVVEDKVQELANDLERCLLSGSCGGGLRKGLKATLSDLFSGGPELQRHGDVNL